MGEKLLLKYEREKTTKPTRSDIFSENLSLTLLLPQMLQQVFMLKPDEQLTLYYGLQDSLVARGILEPPPAIQ